MMWLDMRNVRNQFEEHGDCLSKCVTVVVSFVFPAIVSPVAMTEFFTIINRFN